MGKEKNKFNALTPEVLEENEPIYTEALDYAFNNSDIKNIAITGIYGAGKSTVWKTYVNDKKLSNIITVSLGKYEDDSDGELPNSKSKPKTKDLDNRVERQLINQMLSQIKSSQIPLSKYKFKGNISFAGLLFRIVMTICFIVSILLWFLKEPVIAALQELFRDFNYNYIIYISGAMFFIPIAIFLFTFYKENRVKLSKVNLKGAEANLKDENNDETVLDRDIKEIVYLLNSSESNVIVFEDLDRYDNVEIFTKLRELSFLLNSFIKANVDGRTIRFVYMLKDGLFFSKNRTKFFDFILPIVPVVDSKTSENKLIELLNGVENAPDRNVLANISLYIDDMRLLKNIVNEYIVYSEIIPFRKIDLESKKLFALITLKNIFPNEFDLLQEDRGFVRSIFDKLEDKRKTLKSNLESELAKVKEKIQFINNRIENDKFQLMALMIPADVRLYDQESKTWAEFLKEWHEEDREVYISYYGGNRCLSYEDFVNCYIANTEDKKSIIDKMPKEKGTELNKLNSEVKKISKQIRSVEIYSFKELISNMTLEQREELFLDDNYRITESHYFPLIRFLIVDGLLDETYWYYKGNFEVDTSVTLKRNDIIYMKSLLEGKKLDVFLDVETPSEIINRLDISDFSRFNILNKNIFKTCLDRKLDEYVIAITDSVDTNDSYEDLIKIIDDLELGITEKYVEVLLKKNTDNLMNILDLCKGKDITTFKNILISILTNTSISPDKLELFSLYIEQNENLISLISEEKFDTFVNNVLAANIKFIDLSETEVGNEKLKQLERIQAYKLDVRNVIFIAENILGKNINYGNLLSEIYQAQHLISSKDYIEDNFIDFIAEYIDRNSNEEPYTNKEDILIEILTSDISEESKIKYVSMNETTVSNINDLERISENEIIFKYLLNANKIEFSADNIKTYCSMIKKYGKEFVDYIDRNIDESNAEDILINNKTICNSFINTTLVSDRLFEFALKYADKQIAKIKSNLSAERVNALIRNDLLEATSDNIETLLDNSYNKELVMLASSDDQDIADDVITKLLSYKLPIDLIYMLINSNISNENAMKLIGLIEDSVLIEKIDTSRDDVIESIIDNGLSDDNIDYICKTFESFKLKSEFIEYLNGYSKLEELDNENLNEHVIRYVLKTTNIDTSTKINLIITKIKNEPKVDVLREYISLVKEIADLADVWDGKYPKLDNSYKEKIGQALIKNKYVSPRKNKDYQKIWIPKKQRVNLLENHLL